MAANCASALAQMAAASCVQEEREEKEAGETGDAIAQGTRAAAALRRTLITEVTFDPVVACVNLCVQ